MSNSHVPTQKAMDLLAGDMFPVCPNCDNVCPPGATVCECGGRLTLTAIPKVAAPGPHIHGCTCDGGTCTACVIAELEGDVKW